MSTKIQINCLKALETLLNSDPDFEVAFRKAVLLEYERKHVLPQITAYIERLVTQVATKEIGSIEWNGVRLNEKMKEKLTREAKVIAEEMITKIAKEAVKEICTKEYVEAVITSAVNDELITRLRKQIIDKIATGK